MAGQQLDEHDNPGEATPPVLDGSVRLATADDTCDAATGELITVLDACHHLEALQDAVVLLTVAKT